MKSLSKYIVVAAILSLSNQTIAQLDNPYIVEKHSISDSIYTFVRPNWLRVFVVGNATVLKTGEGLIVFDSGNSPYVANQVIEAIKADSDMPVKYLILSHGHIDHTGGSARFKQEWPNIEIIGHSSLYNYMKRDEGRLIKYAEGHEERNLKRDSLLTAYKSLGYSKELLAYFRQYLEVDSKFIADQYRKTSISLPTLLFEDSLNINLGGNLYTVFKGGNGNTPSDVMLYSRKDKLLITGDVVTRPIPYGYSDNGVEWTGVLDNILKMDLEVVIPGHGDPLFETQFIRKQRDLFNYLIGEIREAVKNNIELPDMKARLNLEPFRNYFSDNDPVARFRFDDWFIDPFCERNYSKLKMEHQKNIKK